MKAVSIFTSLCFILGFLLFIGCNKDESEPEFIDPADGEALSQVLILPDGANRSAGNAPSPTNSAGVPTVTNPLNIVTSSNGSTAPLAFNYNDVSGNLGGCYVQIPGTSSFFTIPYNSNLSSSGSLAVPIGIPVNVLQGDFELNFCVYDTDGQVSNVVSTQVNVLRLGTGSLQISLSWDTPTDQDLYLVDPSGTEIYYGNEISETGGQLDRDDTDGYGPENIYWLESAPDGTYKVSVNDYEGSFTPNTVYVTVNAPGKSKNFTATTSGGSTVEIVTIRKSGDDYDF